MTASTNTRPGVERRVRLGQVFRDHHALWDRGWFAAWSLNDDQANATWSRQPSGFSALFSVVMMRGASTTEPYFRIWLVRMGEGDHVASHARGSTDRSHALTVPEHDLVDVSREAPVVERQEFGDSQGNGDFVERCQQDGNPRLRRRLRDLNGQFPDPVNSLLR